MNKSVSKSRRQQILERAGCLFRAKGYKATSMKDIAEQMEMEAASLYNHIKSKHEILSELLMGIAYRFEAGMKNIASSSYSPIDKIKALIALHIRITTENQHAIALLTQDWKYLKEPVYGDFMRIRKQYSKDFLAIIKEAMEKGQVKKSNPEIMLNSILSSVRWLYDWYFEDKNVNPVELEIQIIELLLNGFRQREL